MVPALCSHWLALLLTQTVYSTALAIAVVVVLRLFKVRAPAILQAAWCLVLLRLVIPTSWGSPYSLRSLLDSAIAFFVPEGEASVSFSVIQAILTPEAESHRGWMSADLYLGSLGVLWLAGAALTGLALALTVRRFRGMARRAQAVENPGLVAVAQRWRRRFRVRRHITLVSSDACLSPYTTGLLRPMVFLPQDMLDWPLEAAEPAIAHEIAHVARLDELWIVLVNCVKVVFFFNPTAWIAASRLAFARERSCDEQVLAGGEISASAYGRGLLDVLRLHLFGSRETGALVSLIARRPDLTVRLTSLLGGRRRRLPTAPIVAAAALIGLFVLPMAQVPQALELDTATIQDPVGEPSTEGIPYFVADSGVSEPEKIEGPHPVYPEEARRDKIQGAVVIDTIIDPDGIVRDAKVLESPSALLSESAVEAVQRWRFAPATYEGRPVSVRYVLTVRFNLQ
jgi:TonB family protein